MKVGNRSAFNLAFLISGSRFLLALLDFLCADLLRLFERFAFADLTIINKPRSDRFVCRTLLTVGADSFLQLVNLTS